MSTTPIANYTINPGTEPGKRTTGDTVTITPWTKAKIDGTCDIHVTHQPDRYQAADNDPETGHRWRNAEWPAMGFFVGHMIKSGADEPVTINRVEYAPVTINRVEYANGNGYVTFYPDYRPGQHYGRPFELDGVPGTLVSSAGYHNMTDAAWKVLSATMIEVAAEYLTAERVRAYRIREADREAGVTSRALADASRAHDLAVSVADAYRAGTRSIID